MYLTYYIKLKFFLWTKLQQNLLLTKYLYQSSKYEKDQKWLYIWKSLQG